MSGLWRQLFGGGSSSQQLQETAKFSLIKNITITQAEIDRGSYGVIYKAIYCGKECVAKEIHSILLETGGKFNTVVQSFIREVNILSTLRHPSIVHFLGVHFREGSHIPVLIMEKMWISLSTWLSKTAFIPLFIKVNIIKDVACGLTYLHSHDPPILHRDLSTGNILLNKNMDAKIADLGLAKALETGTKQRLSTLPGTLAFMPPEARKHKPVYTDRLDIFSLGCVIIHTVTGEFPDPTDEHTEAIADRNRFVKIPESIRREKYIEMMREKCPYLTSIALDCLKDIPMDRPDADTVFSRIGQWWSEPEVGENCSDSLLQHSELDKASLIVSLDSQATRTEELETAVKQYEARVQQLATSTSSKDEQISCLLQSNNDQLISMQSQQSEIDQLKSQCDKLSQQFSNEIVMKQNNMLKQEDMKEKQDEINILKLKLSNLEKSYETLRKESKEKDRCMLEENRQLKLSLKKKAKLIEVMTNEKESLINEKEKLQLQLQIHVTDLQSRQKEVENLKAKVGKSSETLESDRQSIYKEDIGQSCNNEHDSQSSQNIACDKQRKTQNQIQDMSAKVQKMQEENEKLRYKLKQAEESYHKQQEEIEQKMKDNAEYGKAKMESSDVGELESERCRLDQENKKLKQQILQANVPGSYHLLTELNKNVKEMQIANERFAHREKQMSQSLTIIEKQKKKISELSIAKSTAKQQLEEKSIRISSLRSQLSTCQQKLDAKDKEFSDIESQNETLQKLLTNESNLHRSSQKELEIYKGTHKDELKSSQENFTNDNEKLQADLRKLQNLIDEKEKQMVLLNESLQKCHEVILQHQGKIKDLEKECKRLAISHSKLSCQLENKLKEKAKHIEALEKKSYSAHSSHYQYSFHWSPYFSLPVKRIKPSAAIVKDKVFVTGGYQGVSPQGRELDSYLKLLERGNEVFCFHTTKCRCDSIASPVVLGGVASVNGQCVLVSGAEGNTLTGNVYVLCEEGSNEQWKKFSEPVPTPRILPCVCCYGDRWLIVCGGYACKEGSNLLEAVNVVEVLDTTKGKWYTLPETGSSNLSTTLACSIVGDNMYITGDDKILRSSCNKLVSSISASSADIVWDEVRLVPHEVDSDFHSFGVVDVNGEPMIIASISGSEDDVTCVLMKDTTDTWRKMSEAVECQHCSAVVVTPTLELLLFGGSGNVQLAGGTEICQNCTLIPTLNVWANKDEKTATKDSITPVQENVPGMIPIVAIQTPVSFNGVIHTKQFDHKGGTFQSPVHKVSIVVPPNAIDDGEKVTVHMGATTSGPFDLPEDCKLRSAVVWLGRGNDVMLKRSIAVVVPHSAVFTSPQHHSMMRFLTCEDCEGPRYKLQPVQNNFEIAPGYGLIRLQKPAMVAIVSQLKSIVANGSTEENVEHKSVDVPVCYIAKLFWPPKCLPVCFRADVVCVQNIPSELFKVDTYRKDYYEKNETYPAAVGTKLIVYESKLKCILPCDSSNQCSCFTGWGVTPLIDQEEENASHIKVDSEVFSFKFSCTHPGAFLSCCFELQGANRETQIKLENLPKCLMSRFSKFGTYPPILLQSGVSTTTNGTGSGDGEVGSHDQEKLKEKP